jgi:HD-like signal output (HDOD) protein
MRNAAMAKIPAFPAVVLRVVHLLANDDVRVADLVELIDSDALFSAQLLRVANSPLYGFRSQIDSVQLAIVALGLSRLHTLALSVATADYMKAGVKTKELERCWRHTLASAIICRALARAWSLPEERAYTVGLLHDIGRLGLAVGYPSEYAAMLRDSDGDAQALMAREVALFGVDHCEAGQFLVEDWGLPSDFRLITGRHHESPSVDSPEILVSAYLACQMADSMGFSVVELPQPPALEKLCAMLPAAARHRFLAEAGTLKATIDLAIDAHDLTGGVAPEPAVEEPEPEPEPGPQFEAPPLFTSLPSSSSTWKPAVVATTVLVFLAALAAASFLLRS